MQQVAWVLAVAVLFAIWLVGMAELITPLDGGWYETEFDEGFGRGSEFNSPH